MTAPEQWELELETALAAASPEHVLLIMQKIEGWLLGYCTTCGKFSDLNGGKMACECHQELWSI